MEQAVRIELTHIGFADLRFTNFATPALILKWTQRDLNPRPWTYEVPAANQLSYGSVNSARRSLPWQAVDAASPEQESPAQRTNGYTADFGRCGRSRTLTLGFGDQDATATPHTYEFGQARKI